MKRNTVLSVFLVGTLILSACSSNAVLESSVIETLIETDASEEIVSEETIIEETIVEEVASTTVPIEDLTLDYSEIYITSNDLNDGIWDARITYTMYGENVSHDLSWDDVEGAEVYAIYMIDLDATWLHMIAFTTDTSIPEGFVDGENGNLYVGPYPPSGTHNYVVYVIALRDYPQQFFYRFDSDRNYINSIAGRINIDVNGNTDNVICGGMLSGTYTNGDS